MRVFRVDDVKVYRQNPTLQGSPGRMGEDAVRGGDGGWLLIAAFAIALAGGAGTVTCVPANAAAAPGVAAAPSMVAAATAGTVATAAATAGIEGPEVEFSAGWPAGWVAPAGKPPHSSGILLAQSSWFDRAKELLQNSTTDGSSAGGVSVGDLTDTQIGNGLREALRVGTERVVQQLAAVDGFNADPQIHIPLPPALKTVQSALSRFGMGGMADDLELRLNRAAEAAVPEAKALFWNAIEQMTLDDVRGIYNGPDNAATTYFQGKMSAPLTERMMPIVESSLAEVGAVQLYDRMIASYRDIPFVPDVKADLTAHVIDKALEGMFLYVGREEAAIRQNPAERTTDLLKTVFGAK
jgi:hypothetical protein